MEVRWANQYASQNEIIYAETPQEACEKFIKKNGSKNVAVIVNHGWFSVSRFSNHIKAASEDSIQEDHEDLSLAIGIVEKAKIAKEAIKHFPHDELNVVADLLDGASEVRKAVEELNLKLIPIYENLLYESLDEEYRSDKYQDKRETLLQEIIKIGLRGIIKENNFSDGELPLPSTREIQTGSKWKEIKGKLD